MSHNETGTVSGRTTSVSGRAGYPTVDKPHSTRPATVDYVYLAGGE
jgi:hypothetical protein